MEQKLIENFLNNHVDKKWFEKDFELFKKQFPGSKLIPHLELVQEGNKKEMDERICAELMMNGGVCDCTIWENRGFTINAEGFIVPLKRGDQPLDEEQNLLEFDLEVEKPKYNDLKKLIFDLKIPTADNKVATYVEALKAKKAELKAKYAKSEPKDGEGDKDANTDTTSKKEANNTESANATDQTTDAAKVPGSGESSEKKEDPNTNIQQ